MLFLFLDLIVLTFRSHSPPTPSTLPQSTSVKWFDFPRTFLINKQSVASLGKYSIWWKILFSFQWEKHFFKRLKLNIGTDNLTSLYILGEVKNILQWRKYATHYIFFMLCTKNVVSSKIEQIENWSVCLKKWSEATTSITYAEIWLALLLLKCSDKFKPSEHLYISHGWINSQRQATNNINKNKALCAKWKC